MLGSKKQFVAKILVLFILTVFFPHIICAQQNEPVRKNKPPVHNIFRHQPKGMDRKINTHNELLKNSNSNYPSNVSDLAEFQELPFQYPNVSSYEAVPIALSNGNIMMLWASYDGYEFTADDSIYCATSTDGGLTWINKKNVTHSLFNTIFYVTGLQTNNGRIIVFWTDFSNSLMKMSYSDNNGDSWSSVTSIASSYPTWYPSVSQSLNNTIYLSYSRDVSQNYSDIVFRTSTDNGLTWGVEKILTNNQVTQNMGTIIPDTGNGLLAIYSRWIDNNSSWGIVKRSSTNGGDLWSAETIVIDNLNNEDNSRAVRVSNDTLSLLYWQWDWYNRIYDFYYIISGDNGSTWSNPIQFTRYAGYDGYVSNFCLYNNKPFVAFVSDRWQPIFGVTHVQFGIIGITEDDNPPPAVIYSAAQKHYLAPGQVETILGKIRDESDVQNVQVNISLNGGTKYSLQMFDDGQHSDWGIGDGIYGVPVGPFSLSDHLDYNFSATDINNNAINVQGFAIDVVHHGNPINPNKGFEESPVGVISGNITGWGFWTAPSASAVFEVIDDTVKEGNRALKVQVSNLGENDWDILATNEPYSLAPNIPYRYFIWAKADKNNTFVDFTLGEVEGSFFSEWLIAYNVSLTTEWQEYSFDFFPQLSTGRARISFSLDVNSTSLPIKFYIDDLRVVKLDLSVGVEDDEEVIPTKFLLEQNYPNPFNPSTKISYSIPHKSFVTLKVFDPLGSIVRELVGEEKEAGRYEMDFNAVDLSSGVYFYKIEAGDFSEIKKMVLLR